MDDNKQNYEIQNLFYNKRANSERSSFVEKRARLMQLNPIPLQGSASILGHTQIFKVFSKQTIAIKYAKEIGLGLMVFAFEGRAVGEDGRRNFLVCHPRRLWKNIKDRPPDYRCTYEVIPEGEISKLYFDLEYSKELNPKVDGNYLISLFIRVVNYYLIKEFNIICDVDQVLDLESSTDTKFSRHLIYNHPEIYFESNYHVGRFVNMICKILKKTFHEENSEISIPNVSQDDVKKLFVKASSSTVLICDQGVYTKNRNFRIFGSTKLGKHSPLVIASQNKYKSATHTESCDENYFLDSLVSFVSTGVQALKYGSDECSATKSFSKCSKSNSLEDDENSPKYSASPYPEIEYFINNYLGQGTLIRTWRYFSEGELLVFDIDKRHRFCNNIGREHKSNSIMYVVNLRSGVFYQKCHDPVCKGYKSNEIKLPDETMPWKMLRENISDESDDEVLVAAVESAEKKELECRIYCNNNNNNSLDKMKQSLFTPSIGISKSSENLTILPSPWSHLSEIESPLNVSEDLNSEDNDNTSLLSSRRDSFQECISDEEMLQVYTKLDC